MNDFNYTHTCGRCAATLFVVTNASAQAWKADAAQGGHRATCGCGCTFTTEDDGNPSGGVQAKDVSAPEIVSLDVATGPIAGGTTVQLTGDAFQVPGATPVVKFGGLTAAPTVLTDTTLDAVTPAGKARLLIDKMFARVEHGAVTGGPYQVAEIITGGTSGETATVVEVGADYVLVDALSGPLTASETLTGGTSSATSAFSAIGASSFSDGETLTGATSSATATLLSVSGLWIQGPSGPFTAGEEVSGGTSGARAQLADPTWYDGAVDVTVENENGQRTSGGTLAAGFEFTI